MKVYIIYIKDKKMNELNINVNKLEGFYQIDGYVCKIYGYTFDKNIFDMCIGLFNQSDNFIYIIDKIKRRNKDLFRENKEFKYKSIISRELDYENGQVAVYLPVDLYNEIKFNWLYMINIENIISKILPINISLLKKPYIEMLSMYGLISLVNNPEYDLDNINSNIFSIDSYYYDKHIKIKPNELSIFISYIHGKYDYLI